MQVSAKELLLSQIKSTLEDKKLDQAKIDQVIKSFTDQELTSWSFDYKDSQIILYPANPEETLEEIALPISSFFDVLESLLSIRKGCWTFTKHTLLRKIKSCSLTLTMVQILLQPRKLWIL